MSIENQIFKTEEETRLCKSLELYQPAQREVAYFGIGQAIVDHIESSSKDVSYKDLSVNFSFRVKEVLSDIVNLTIVDIDYLSSICNNLFKLSHLAYQETGENVNVKSFFSFIGLSNVISQATVENIDRNFKTFSNAYYDCTMYLMKRKG